jgi:hypothetical protein
MDANKALTQAPERGTAKAYSEAWHEQFNKMSKQHQDRILSAKNNPDDRDPVVSCFAKEVIYIAENGPRIVEPDKPAKEFKLN